MFRVQLTKSSGSHATVYRIADLHSIMFHKYTPSFFPCHGHAKRPQIGHNEWFYFERKSPILWELYISEVVSFRSINVWCVLFNEYDLLSGVQRIKLEFCFMFIFSYKTMTFKMLLFSIFTVNKSIILVKTSLVNEKEGIFLNTFLFYKNKTVSVCPRVLVFNTTVLFCFFDEFLNTEPWTMVVGK